jgi:hypothetical protein
MLSRDPASRPRLRALLVGLCATAGLLLLSSSPAHASITHPYTGTSFGPGGVGSGDFTEVMGVAVAQTTGDVFVLDAGEGGKLYKFDAAGEPVDFSSTSTNVIEGVGSAGGAEEEIAVDDSTGPDAGDIYVANNQTVRIYATTGAFLGELSGGEMCGVAVGTTGEVYVGVYPELVRRYAPVSNPVTNANENASMAGLSGVCNVAVDSAGDVYAARYSGEVTKYQALQFGSLSASGTLVDNAGNTLAVDPISGEVLIDAEDRVEQYDGSVEPPTLEGTTGASGDGALNVSLGVAVDHSSGDVYAANLSTVEIFGPGVVLAGVSTGAATGVSTSAATLHGTVEPDGTEVTGCVFEYGAEAGALSHSVPCEPTLPYTGSSPVAVSAQVTGLQAGSIYHYRLAATNKNGTGTSTEESFTTAGPRISNEFAPEYGLGATRAVVSAEIDPAGEATTYRVEYGTTTAYGSSTGPVELEAGEAPVPVTVHITGLQPNTTYHYRFLAENAAATAIAGDLTFTTSPIVSDETIAQVGSDSAELRAQVDASGEATTYQVEYGTSAAYGSTTQPVSVGAGEAPVGVVARLSELQPETKYHFRFVAEKAVGSEASPDLTFTTHPLSTSGLPDGRGYELVTPVDSEGGEPYLPSGSAQEGEDLIDTSYPAVAAADGEAVAYAGSPSAGGNGNQGDGGGNEFLARRAATGGWTQSDIQPPGYATPTYWAFSSDLSGAILLSTEALTSGAPDGYANLYIRNDISGGDQPLFSVTPPNRSAQEFGAAGVQGYAASPESLGEHYAGASEDFSNVLFEANDALTSEAVDPGPEANDLYDFTDGELRSVNVLPDGSAAPNASFGSPPSGESVGAVNFSHVISTTGARIFWTDLNTGSLYVRENGSRTSLIAEGATYLTAAADGSKVLFTKGGDLYEDDLSSGVTSDLLPGGQVQGLVGASNDLEYIYVVAQGAVVSGATEGKSNLYVLHQGTTRFIATLGFESEENIGLTYSNGLHYPWQPDPGFRTAEVTESGEGLVFMSHNDLTGESPEQFEVYVYEADGGELTCVSCDHTGEQPTGFSLFGGLLTPSDHNAYQRRLISNDGSRVFFESNQPLVPQATDGKTNVYEWERDGAGSCTRVTGCIFLLSTGASSTPSYFLDASASGDDVFIMTRSRLVPADKNEYNDVYDVRVGATEPATTPQCAGTGCQGVAAPPPIFATPPSVTFSGVGNFPPTTSPASKPKPKPKPKKANKCTARRHKKGKASRHTAARRVSCRAKKAIKRSSRSKSGRGGR